MTIPYEQADAIIRERLATGEHLPADALLDPVGWLEREERGDIPITVDCPHAPNSPESERWWRTQWTYAIRRGDVDPRAEDAAPPVLPAFPLHALPPAMRDAVATVAANKRVPADMPALLALSCLAVVAGPRLAISRGKDWIEPLIEWTLTIAETGEGKSPAVAVFQETLRDVQQWITSRHVDEIDAQTKDLEAQIAALTRTQPNMTRDEQDRTAAIVESLNDELEQVKARKPPQVLTGGSSTLESIERTMSANAGHVAILDDEGGAFGIISGVYNNGTPTGLDTILKGYGASYVPANERINRSVDPIPRAVLTYGITAQSVTLFESFRMRSLRDRGFHARWCYAIPEPVVGTRAVDPPDLDYRALDEFTHTLKAVASMPVIGEHVRRRDWPTLELSREARKLHIELQTEVEPRQQPDIGDLAWMGDWVNKYVGRVLRHAGLLHLAAGYGLDTPVSEETMRAAIAVGEWALAHAAEVYRRAPKVPLTVRRTDRPDTSLGEQKILRWIAKKQAVVFSGRDVFNQVRKQSWCTGAEDVQAALVALRREGLLRTVPRLGRDGRELPAAPWWVAHPDLVYGR